jgi:hypothetical protein
VGQVRSLRSIAGISLSRKVGNFELRILNFELLKWQYAEIVYVWWRYNFTRKTRSYGFALQVMLSEFNVERR